MKLVCLPLIIFTLMTTKTFAYFDIHEPLVKAKTKDLKSGKIQLRVCPHNDCKIVDWLNPNEEYYFSHQAYNNQWVQLYNTELYANLDDLNIVLGHLSPHKRIFRNDDNKFNNAVKAYLEEHLSVFDELSDGKFDNFKFKRDLNNGFTFNFNHKNINYSGISHHDDIVRKSSVSKIRIESKDRVYCKGKTYRAVLDKNKSKLIKSSVTLEKLYLPFAYEEKVLGYRIKEGSMDCLFENKMSTENSRSIMSVNKWLTTDKRAYRAINKKYTSLEEKYISKNAKNVYVQEKGAKNYIVHYKYDSNGLLNISGGVANCEFSRPITNMKIKGTDFSIVFTRSEYRSDDETYKFLPNYIYAKSKLTINDIEIPKGALVQVVDFFLFDKIKEKFQLAKSKIKLGFALSARDYAKGSSRYLINMEGVWLNDFEQVNGEYHTDIYTPSTDLKFSVPKISLKEGEALNYKFGFFIDSNVELRLTSSGCYERELPPTRNHDNYEKLKDALKKYSIKKQNIVSIKEVESIRQNYGLNITFNKDITVYGMSFAAGSIFRFFGTYGSTSFPISYVTVSTNTTLKEHNLKKDDIVVFYEDGIKTIIRNGKNLYRKNKLNLDYTINKKGFKMYPLCFVDFYQENPASIQECGDFTLGFWEELKTYKIVSFDDKFMEIETKDYRNEIDKHKYPIGSLTTPHTFIQDGQEYLVPVFLNYGINEIETDYEALINTGAIYNFSGQEKMLFSGDLKPCSKEGESITLNYDKLAKKPFSIKLNFRRSFFSRACST